MIEWVGHVFLSNVSAKELCDVHDKLLSVNYTCLIKLARADHLPVYS